MAVGGGRVTLACLVFERETEPKRERGGRCLFFRERDQVREEENEGGDEQVVLEGALLIVGVEAVVLNCDGERETRNLFTEKETAKNEKK